MNAKMIESRILRIQRFIERAQSRITRESLRLQTEFAWSKDPVPFDKRLELEYKSAHEGDLWGHAWESSWFHLRGVVPKEWTGKRVLARLDFSGEGLVFNPDGTLRQGICTRSIFDPYFIRDLVPLFDSCRGGEEVELWVEAAANSLFGVFTEPDPANDSPLRYGQFDARVNALQLCTFDAPLWGLILDLKVFLGLIRALPEKSVRRARLLHTGHKALDVYDDTTEGVARSREILAVELQMPASASDLSVTAVGHAHLDTAWLWPVRETIRKCARTFATQLDLIARYPGYIFGASQPQHYQFVKDHYPELYSRIKRAISEERWEPQGGMWVEADCNIPSGESLIRQILHGKNFYRDEFGMDVDNLWLPDVFGYSAALPQIMRRSGIRFFLTQKLSWNQVNEFPHHTFLWRGIDGSEVLCHFPPENTYNSTLEAESLVKGRDNFRERAYLEEFLCLFGVGDGGGGPKEDHLEFGLRQKNLEGCPRVKFSSAREFFHRLEARGKELPVWSGELYLEGHRGTLTTQARMKAMNRDLEYRLKEAEMLWSCLPLDQYPFEELKTVWRKLLLSQFHDILPGSSITSVYKEVGEDLHQARRRVGKLIEEAAARLFQAADDSLVIFNPLPYAWDGPMPADKSSGQLGLTNSEEDLLPRHRDPLTFAEVHLKPYSFLTLKKAPGMISEDIPFDTPVLENDLVRYEFNERGQLIRAYDKEVGVEILEPGKVGNVLTLYADYPNDWDAWDIDLTYESQVLASLEPLHPPKVNRGSLQQRLQIDFKFGDDVSHSMEASLYNNSKSLHFVLTIRNWSQRHRMLRVSFPVNILADQGSFDIQYGYVRRPNHRNTSWDLAKFEVAAHRYMDLSGPDYGVALLNDSKYGCKIYGNILDLNLLRSTSYPDPDADRCGHQFTYVLLPHSGDLVHSNVMAEAAKLNERPLLFKGVKTGLQRLPWRVEGEGLSLEVVKKAEKEDCLILRIVETLGRRSTGKLIVNHFAATLMETNLMEWEEGASYSVAQPLTITLAPFEIRTYKLK